MKKASNEFIFLRDKLKEIARSLMTENYIEASFIIGCLHSVCHENALYFNDEEIRMQE